MDNLATNWNHFYDVIKTILDEEITDDYFRVLFNKLNKDDVSQGKKIIFVII